MEIYTIKHILVNYSGDYPQGMMNIIKIIIFNNCSKIIFEFNLLIDLVSLITEKKHKSYCIGLSYEALY